MKNFITLSLTLLFGIYLTGCTVPSAQNGANRYSNPGYSGSRYARTTGPDLLGSLINVATSSVSNGKINMNGLTNSARAEYYRIAQARAQAAREAAYYENQAYANNTTSNGFRRSNRSYVSTDPNNGYYTEGYQPNPEPVQVTYQQQKAIIRAQERELARLKAQGAQLDRQIYDIPLPTPEQMQQDSDATQQSHEKLPWESEVEYRARLKVAYNQYITKAAYYRQLAANAPQ